MTTKKATQTRREKSMPEWGKIESVDGNAVRLTYEKHLDEKGRVIHTEAGPIRYSEVLHVTPNGLE